MDVTESKYYAELATENAALRKRMEELEDKLKPLAALAGQIEFKGKYAWMEPQEILIGKCGDKILTYDAALEAKAALEDK